MRKSQIGSIVLLTAVIFAIAGCSRVGEDWKAAQTADTTEAYQDFLRQHPDSEYGVAAQERVRQLAEDRDWQQASKADTLDAYQQFVAVHADGKWAQEARVRIENFQLSAGGQSPPSVPGAEGAGQRPGRRPARRAAAAPPAKPKSARKPKAATPSSTAAATAKSGGQALRAAGRIQLEGQRRVGLAPAQRPLPDAVEIAAAALRDGVGLKRQAGGAPAGLAVLFAAGARPVHGTEEAVPSLHTPQLIVPAWT